VRIFRRSAFRTFDCSTATAAAEAIHIVISRESYFFLDRESLNSDKNSPQKGEKPKATIFLKAWCKYYQIVFKKRIGWTHQKIKMKILLTESESVQWINGRTEMNAANKSRLVQYLQTLIKFIAVSDCPRRFR
jgi:hypothetical protein